MYQKRRRMKGKKTKRTDEVVAEAKRVKKMDSKEKRDKEKEREAVNIQISRQMTENNNAGNHINTCCPDHSISVTSYSDESGQPHRDGKLFKMSPSKVQAIQRDNIESSIRSPVNTSPPKTARSASVTVSALPEPSNVSVVEEDPDSSNQNASCIILKPIVTESPDDNSKSSTALVSLGESRYGVKVKKEDLERVKSCSRDVTKMALKMIEFLITPEQCRENLTVYGEGKGKTGMDPDKRRATATDDEQTKIWMDTFVLKLNNKIRGIRYNKYKLK